MTLKLEDKKKWVKFRKLRLICRICAVLNDRISEFVDVIRFRFQLYTSDFVYVIRLYKKKLVKNWIFLFQHILAICRCDKYCKVSGKSSFLSPSFLRMTEHGTLLLDDFTDTPSKIAISRSLSNRFQVYFFVE